MERKTKLTDKQKKKIISDYAITNNQRETARINNVSDTTVKRIITDVRNKDELKIVAQKKEENTKDILEYIDSKYDEQKKVIDLSLTALAAKLQKVDSFTSVKDIATVFGILSDKATKSKELKIREKELELKGKNKDDILSKLDDLLEEQRNA